MALDRQRSTGKANRDPSVLADAVQHPDRAELCPGGPLRAASRVIELLAVHDVLHEALRSIPSPPYRLWL